MQSDYKQIYKIAAEENNISEQLYKDLGNFVFAALYAEMRKPSKLILKLKGVGFWYLRKKRMEIVLREYPMDYSKTETDFSSKFGLFKYESKKEIHSIFKSRLHDYQEFITERNEVRKLRYESQTLLGSSDREVEGPETSKDN